jgi:hypothetical protein
MSQRFEAATYEFDIGKLVDIIREISYARKIFPVDTTVPIEAKVGEYWEVEEDDNVQYNFDLVAPEYSRFALLEKNPVIPVHQGNLAYTRHELKRAAKSKLPVDMRQRLLMEQINQKEESVAIGGHTATGITSFADTTNNSTAYGTNLDLTSFSTAISTWHTSVSQLRALLKDKFQGAQLVQIWTSDVDQRARAVLNTNETETFYDYLKAQIGEDNIISSDYLGSAAGSGTTNAALVPKDPRNLGLLSSNLEIVQGETTLKGLEVEVALRSRPVFFRGVKSCLYDATVDITA